LEPGPLRRPQQCGVSGSRIRCLGHREPARVEKEHLDRSIAETRVDAVVSVAVTGLWTISRIDEPAVLLSRNQSAAIVDPEIVVIPRPPAGARAKQLLVLGHRRKFAVTPRLHLELGAVDVGRVTDQDNAVDLLLGHAFPHGAAAGILLGTRADRKTHARRSIWRGRRGEHLARIAGENAIPAAYPITIGRRSLQPVDPPVNAEIVRLPRLARHGYRPAAGERL